MTNLKHYQCIKQVRAEPMKYGEFVMKYRDGHGSGTVSIMAEGYRVSGPSRKGEEFQSWIPKETFELDYIEVKEAANLTFEERRLLQEMVSE